MCWPTYRSIAPYIPPQKLPSSQYLLDRFPLPSIRSSPRHPLPRAVAPAVIHSGLIVRPSMYSAAVSVTSQSHFPCHTDGRVHTEIRECAAAAAAVLLLPLGTPRRAAPRAAGWPRDHDEWHCTLACDPPQGVSPLEPQALATWSFPVLPAQPHPAVTDADHQSQASRGAGARRKCRWRFQRPAVGRCRRRRRHLCHWRAAHPHLCCILSFAATFTITSHPLLSNLAGGGMEGGTPPGVPLCKCGIPAEMRTVRK